MISDCDLRGIAKLLIHLHGADAEHEAARLADLMLAGGDHDLQRVWERVGGAIVEIDAGAQPLKEPLVGSAGSG